MRGTISVLQAKNICKQIFPALGARAGGIAPSLEPKKQGDDENISKLKMNANENADPIVAYSRPPPLPPFVGPLVALSLVETWLRSDSNDD
ncbi:hypothetical protein Ancab_032704 [Ancistrocladus abbreviatus]